MAEEGDGDDSGDDSGDENTERRDQEEKEEGDEDETDPGTPVSVSLRVYVEDVSLNSVRALRPEKGPLRQTKRLFSQPVIPCTRTSGLLKKLKLNLLKN